MELTGESILLHFWLPNPIAKTYFPPESFPLPLIENHQTPSSPPDTFGHISLSYKNRYISWHTDALSDIPHTIPQILYTFLRRITTNRPMVNTLNTEREFWMDYKVMSEMNCVYMKPIMIYCDGEFDEMFEMWDERNDYDFGEGKNACSMLLEIFQLVGIDVPEPSEMAFQWTPAMMYWLLSVFELRHIKSKGVGDILKELEAGIVEDGLVRVYEVLKEGGMDGEVGGRVLPKVIAPLDIVGEITRTVAVVAGSVWLCKLAFAHLLGGWRESIA
eukprot:TRINITY_DN4039_c0_g1_i1.p1 TRINITY_DN4039_c0_g1~~TRINITY_DN4039_c0_g1_i1.p1  ORF type:complete len:274 (+),score=47.70 TRINITY_DN4039_c0_g1_i1:16-837(+)